jgi:hypothetical protein
MKNKTFLIIFFSIFQTNLFACDLVSTFNSILNKYEYFFCMQSDDQSEDIKIKYDCLLLKVDEFILQYLNISKIEDYQKILPDAVKKIIQEMNVKIEKVQFSTFEELINFICIYYPSSLFKKIRDLKNQNLDYKSLFLIIEGLRIKANKYKCSDIEKKLNELEQYFTFFGYAFME